jgi:TRAP-type uncharacterized transport system substrate-binding protein
MKKLFLALTMMASCSVMAAPPLTVCTGGPGGAYEALGKEIGKAIVDKVKVTSPTELVVLNTGGSVENAQRVTNRTCAMAIMQGDAVASRGLPRDIKVSLSLTAPVLRLPSRTSVLRTRTTKTST